MEAETQPATAVDILKYDIGQGNTRRIYIGRGILDKLANYAADLNADKFFVITDSAVDKRFCEKVKAVLGSVAETNICSFPSGEASKTLTTLEEMGGCVLDGQATKSSVIVCLGGGVVGNLGGLLAALLFRGLRFFHIPTSMVAQIDSAIGVKQAVNYKKGKNLFGQYYPPQFVFIDLMALRTLPERHVKAGLAEAVKHALCQEPDFFDYLEENAGKYTWEMIEYISRHTIELKLALLKIDPYEGKLDPQLELGHTIGHAVEIIENGGLLHGESIAIGMVVESRLSVTMGLMEQSLHEKIVHIFEKIGLPIKIPAAIPLEDVLETLKFDNKRKTARTDFFLLEDFTRFNKTNGKIGTRVPEELLRDVLERSY